MKDISVLIVKPEVIDRKNEVRKSVRRRGYFELVDEQRAGWREIMQQLYGPQFAPEYMQAFLHAYASRWSDRYGLFVLEHMEGDTLPRLKADQGHFRSYQDGDDGSLRAEFGLPASYNIPYHASLTMVFNGLHCPGTEEDLQRHLQILELHEFA